MHFVYSFESKITTISHYDNLVFTVCMHACMHVIVTLNFHFILGVSKNISTFDGYVATTFEEQLDSTADHIQFRFVQLEHRGGTCDCWAVANLNFKSGEYEVNFK